MRLSVTIAILLVNSLLRAQNTVVSVNLPAQEKQKKTVPFYFKEIIFSSDVSDTIGMINPGKKKGNTYARLPINRTLVVLDFLRTRFEENKGGSAIQLDITKLKVAPTESGIFSHKDTFQFQCKFYAFTNNEKVVLYSFIAKNPFGTFNDAENVLANYISRALISSVEKFKDSFENNPDWFKPGSDENSGEKKAVKISTLLNKIASPDSIPCTSSRKLTWDDFQEHPAGKEPNNNGYTDSGSAKIILTYRANAEETNKHLKLTIFVNAFLNKRNSWKPKNSSDLQWLEYQQGHFDLVSIYGIKLYNKFKNHSFSLGAYKTELNTLYNEMNSELISLRKQYKADTEDGKRADQMLIWRKKIEELRDNPQ